MLSDCSLEHLEHDVMQPDADRMTMVWTFCFKNAEEQHVSTMALFPREVI